MTDSYLDKAEVTAAEAIAIVAADGAFLVDVREDDEWEAGHVPAAHHIPLGELASRRDEIPQDRQVLLICRSGGRSARATDALAGADYHATNVVGGSQAWERLGGPFETSDGSPGVVI